MALNSGETKKGQSVVLCSPSLANISPLDDETKRIRDNVAKRKARSIVKISIGWSDCLIISHGHLTKFLCGSKVVAGKKVKSRWKRDSYSTVAGVVRGKFGSAERKLNRSRDELHSSHLVLPSSLPILFRSIRISNFALSMFSDER